MVSFTTKDGKKVEFKTKGGKKKTMPITRADGSKINVAVGKKKPAKKAPVVPKVKSEVKKATGKKVKGTLFKKGGIGLVQSDGTNKGNIPNKKLKCWMRTAPSGGVYRTCAVPEKKKQPKKQVRGKPRVGGKGGEKAVSKEMKVKRKTDAKKARATANPKRQTITKADGSVGVVRMKTKAQKAQAKRNLKDKQTMARIYK